MPHDQSFVQGAFFFLPPPDKKATLRFPGLIVDMLVGDRPRKGLKPKEGLSVETLVVMVVLLVFGWSCLARKPAGETGAG